MICERCSNAVHQVDECNYCHKKVCGSCLKASKRVKKTDRYAICRGCWGDLKARTKWKKV